MLMALFGFLKKEEKEKLDQGMEKTRSGFMGKIGKALVGKTKVDVEFLDELEEILISSDVGLDTTIKIIDNLEARAAKDKYISEEELNKLLRDEIEQLFAEEKQKVVEPSPPKVILVVGVNGVGRNSTWDEITYSKIPFTYDYLLSLRKYLTLCTPNENNHFSHLCGRPMR